MTLSVLAYGFFLFFFALVAHVLLWNLFKIKKEILWLTAVFIVIPGLIMLSWRAMDFSSTESTIAIGMLYAALAVVYMQTYPALREDIPSIRILMTVQEHSGSMMHHEIIAHLAQQKLFETKIADLENDALIYIRENRMHLTTMGAVLAKIFRTYRRLLGYAVGRG